MIKRKITRVATGLVFIAASMSAIAEESGWYLGFSGGKSEADLDRAEFDAIVVDAFSSAGAPVLTGTSSLDDGDTAWSAIAGYHFSPFFSLEASYTNFGTAKYRSSGTVNPPGPITSAPASYSADFEVAGFSVGAIGSIPLDPMFDIHARGGILFSDVAISQRATIGSSSATDNLSANSQDLLYGLGVGCHVNQHWSLNVDWQRFTDVGDEDKTGESDVDALTLNFIFRL